MKKNKMNEIKRECQKFLGLSAVWMSAMAFTQLSFAQSNVVADEGSGNSGGGNITEVDLRYYMGKIDTYLLSEEGRNAFPEIVAYDEAHPTEKFHDLILNTKPVVQKGELRDANGVVRDCMSYANPGNHYFVCNSDALPDKTLDNQPSFYRIVLHELLVQAGIEKPLSKEIPSVYSVSSRITDNVHLETYQEWVPGKGGIREEKLLDSGLVCTNYVQGLKSQSIFSFVIDSSGEYALYRQKASVKRRRVIGLGIEFRDQLTSVEIARSRSNDLFTKSEAVYTTMIHRDKNTHIYLETKQELKELRNTEDQAVMRLYIKVRGKSGNHTNLICSSYGENNITLSTIQAFRSKQKVYKD